MSVTPGRGEENGPLMALTFPEDSLKSNIWLTYNDFYDKSFSVFKKKKKIFPQSSLYHIAIKTSNSQSNSTQTNLTKSNFHKQNSPQTQLFSLSVSITLKREYLW